MARSQNVTFLGEAPPPQEFDHPIGEGLIYYVRDALLLARIPVSEPDNWRDCGWSLICAMTRGEVQIALASTGEGEWFLQVAPVRVAGLVDRVLRRAIPDVSHECVQISRVIDETLKSSGKYSRIRWREDGPPDEANSSNEPGGRR
jgi:hypothetical protein